MLCRHSTLSFYPPTEPEGIERVTLSRWYTRTFSSRCAQPICRHIAGELLPHLLTLTLLRERFFSSTRLSPRGLLPIKKRDALRCPDFPHAPQGAQATDWLTATISQKYIFLSDFWANPLENPIFAMQQRRTSALERETPNVFTL